MQTSSPLAVERDRFLVLFDQLFEHTLAYLRRVPDDVYAAVPIDSSVMFLGTRVNSINIGGLVRHLVLAEAHWFEQVANVTGDGVIPFPQNADILSGIADGSDLLDRYEDVYRSARRHIESLDDSGLKASVTFVGRTYSVIGFLWTILGHHGFHLGQIDLLMRQHDIDPPEYMEWPIEDRLIA